MSGTDNYTPEISRLDHLTLEVRDINEALNFYTKILGLKDIHTPEEVKSKGIRWLSLPNNQALHLIEIKDMQKPSSAHMALVVDDIDPWKKRLSENNIEIKPPKFSIYKAERFFIKDPSGNRIEFLKWIT
jgi:catechol 2,3-dioxygenase-like lactoylglutathione lyase family enzyme